MITKKELDKQIDDPKLSNIEFDIYQYLLNSIEKIIIDQYKHTNKIYIPEVLFMDKFKFNKISNKRIPIIINSIIEECKQSGWNFKYDDAVESYYYIVTPLK